MLRKILSTAFVILLVAWLSIILVDFLKVKEYKDPIFCIKKQTVKHTDNRKTEICTGLGYKVQNYYEDNKHVATEFGPFFIDDRYAENKGD